MGGRRDINRLATSFINNIGDSGVVVRGKAAIVGVIGYGRYCGIDSRVARRLIWYLENIKESM